MRDSLYKCIIFSAWCAESLTSSGDLIIIIGPVISELQISIHNMWKPVQIYFPLNRIHTLIINTFRLGLANPEHFQLEPYYAISYYAYN